MEKQEKLEVLLQALNLMEKKIKKSLHNTNINEREDLEQEIKLKVLEAVLSGKIETPPTFRAYKKEFDRSCIVEEDSAWTLRK